MWETQRHSSKADECNDSGREAEGVQAEVFGVPIFSLKAFSLNGY